MLQKKCLEEKEEKGERMWEKHKKSRKRAGGEDIHTLAKETHTFTNVYLQE
jgi:hypothetical protein